MDKGLNIVLPDSRWRRTDAPPSHSLESELFTKRKSVFKLICTFFLKNLYAEITFVSLAPRLAEGITGLNMFSVFFNIFFGFKNFQFLRSSPSTWFVWIIFISPISSNIKMFKMGEWSKRCAHWGHYDHKRLVLLDILPQLLNGLLVCEAQAGN